MAFENCAAGGAASNTENCAAGGAASNTALPFELELGTGVGGATKDGLASSVKDIACDGRELARGVVLSVATRCDAKWCATASPPHRTKSDAKWQTQPRRSFPRPGSPTSRPSRPSATRASSSARVAHEIGRAASVCKDWRAVVQDAALWHTLLRVVWRVEKRVEFPRHTFLARLREYRVHCTRQRLKRGGVRVALRARRSATPTSPGSTQRRTAAAGGGALDAHSVQQLEYTGSLGDAPGNETVGIAAEAASARGPSARRRATPPPRAR